MSKVLAFIFLFFSVLFYSTAFGYEEINIISREEWGANESYRHLDGPEWRDILKRREEADKNELSEYQKKQIEKQKIANKFLLNNYSDIFNVVSVEKYDGEYKLAWPISKTATKRSIIIHHTEGNYTDSYEAIRSIYKYHSITREWGDIGYNYLIGLDGEIFEGRAGGDYVVGAHDIWNNQGSIGIAVIGNYDKNKLSKSQEESLEKLINYLSEKYKIDYSNKIPFFKWCTGNEKCDKKPIDVLYYYPLIGHRDAGYTSCPGKNLYSKVNDIREDLVKKSNIEVKNRLENANDDNLLDLLATIEEKLDNTNNKYKTAILNKYKYSIINTFAKNNKEKNNSSDISFDDNNKIKVKLSYPENNNEISLTITGSIQPKLIKKENEFILNFEPGQEDNRYKINVSIKDDKLYLNKKEIEGFSKESFFRISSPDNNYLTISSWDRKPVWDKSGKYNDNKFKGDIVLYNKEDELVVVNELFLNDYLKGLGEVSNNTSNEKIKSIIILARTYARWYMTEAKKFPGEWYNASDDSNVFQKYLGYGLEQRSPNVNKVVEDTKNLVVTYKGKIIKPWYFSSSNGQTKDFIDFCKTAKGVPDCKTPEKFPFLSLVKDPGGNGNGYKGHGVGVPGTGVEYFSQRGWNYKMIIKYFLKGVDVKYM